jgi:hypothetical protein
MYKKQKTNVEQSSKKLQKKNVAKNIAKKNKKKRRTVIEEIALTNVQYQRFTEHKKCGSYVCLLAKTVRGQWVSM